MKQMVQSLSAAIFASTLVACSPEATESVTKTKTKDEEHAVHTANWSYTGETGPESWGELDQTYASCVNGSEQSPVNIDLALVKTIETIETLDFQYEPTNFSFLNNGHTIQVENESESNQMLLNGTDYQLVQFHFHTPSEHQFNGLQYEMELHLVHQNKDNQLAVVGVMIKEGIENENLQAIWDALQEEMTDEHIPLKQPINLQSILPQDPTYLYYNGSLTTPPCTEEVKWILIEQPITMSKQQIETFKEIFPDNHRPVQPMNEREIIKN